MTTMTTTRAATVRTIFNRYELYMMRVLRLLDGRAKERKTKRRFSDDEAAWDFINVGRCKQLEVT